MKSYILEKLAVTVSSHADNLCSQMRELGVNRLKTNVGTLEKGYSRSNQGSYTTLSWGDSGGDLTLGKVAIVGDGSYAYGDYDCGPTNEAMSMAWIPAPSPDDLLRYAEGLAEINKAIEELSNERNSRITAAISAFDE